MMSLLLSTMEPAAGVFCLLFLGTAAVLVLVLTMGDSSSTRKFPMIDGGLIEIRGPNKDRLPSAASCFKYLESVFSELELVQAKKHVTSADRRLQLPNGVVLIVKTKSGVPPTKEIFRNYLRAAEMLIDMMEDEDFAEVPKPIMDDLPEAFRVQTNESEPDTSPVELVQHGDASV